MSANFAASADASPFPRIDHRAQVCVIGGGIAGLCAALASARGGAQTLLMQDRPVLGGNASSEVRMWICGARGRGRKEAGLLEEIQLANCRLNHDGNNAVWDAVLWQTVRAEPNLALLLNCSCLAGTTEPRGGQTRLTTVDGWQSTSQTWHRVEADFFIDASGDSILAPITGAATRWGREAADEFGETIAPTRADRKTMGSTILIQMRRTDRPQPFVAPPFAYRFDHEDQFRGRLRGGVQADNFWWIELGGLQDTIHDAEAIRDELLAVAYGVWDYLKNVSSHRAQAEGWALHWVGTVPGKRENRRYEGPHILTEHDVRAERGFGDAVAYGGWPMDDHHPAGLLYPGKPTIFHDVPSPYQIPYACLHSCSVENLLMAGRNISVTHAALSSTRVQGTCATIGQAVGAAAALAVELGQHAAGFAPADLRRLQDRLLRDDAWIPFLATADDPLCQAAQPLIQADGVALTPIERNLEDSTDHAWRGGVGESVGFRFDQPRHIPSLRLVLDSDLNRTKRMPEHYPVSDSYLAMPRPLARGLTLQVQETDGGPWSTLHTETDNARRLLRVPLDRQIVAARCWVDATWGAKTAGVFAFGPGADRAPTSTVSDRPRWADRIVSASPQDLAPPEHGIFAGVADPVGHTA